MGVLVRVKFVEGKVKYLAETEHEKNTIQKLKQFVAAHEGSEAYKYFMDKEEVSENKKLPSFYRMIMLQPLFDKMKDEYGLQSIGECDAVLSLFYLKRKKYKKDGTTYEIPMRVENVPFSDQIDFIARVANFAITKYDIKYPNANEVDGLKS